MGAAATDPRPRRTDGPPEALARQRIAVVRLTFGAGTPAAVDERDWPGVLDRAVRERCGALAWLRSALAIRAHAPQAVIGRWRAHALEAGERAAAQADELHAVLATLSNADVEPIVLKGQPLAMMLYGDVSARPVFDIDLFVALRQRRVAHDVLLAAGWRHLDGLPPAEGTYQRIAPARMPHLEMHSSLLDDGLLAHLRSPEPKRTLIPVAGSLVPAHSDDSLPVFLAVHLAKHGRVPLLWWVDLATLWQRLSANERDAARALAAEHRLSRFLAWGERGVALLDTIAHGTEVEACSALAQLDAMHDGRNAYRVAGLVESGTERAFVTLGWLFPPRQRGSLRALARGAAQRAAKMMGAAAPVRGSRHNQSDQGAFARTLELTPADLASTVRQVVSGGGGAWIRVRGTSMLPTIPRVAEVFVTPAPDRGLSVGDIVLVDRGDAGLLMHRVVAVSDSIVHLRGDNRFEGDRPVASVDIVGLATKVRVGGRVSALERRPRRSLRFVVARWHTRLRRRLAGA